MAEEPVVYDITKVQCTVGGNIMVDVGPAGFGITPGSESTLIKGLYGEIGFNVDPSTAGEATITLKSTSSSIAILRDIWAEKKIVKLSIQVTDANYIAAVGFYERVLTYAQIKSPPEWKTDGKEAPEIVFNFIGYGYDEKSTQT